MLKNFLSFLILSVLVSFNSICQDSLQSDKMWTLEECINYAKKNSLLIQRAILTREANKVNYDQSRASLFPSINGAASTSYNFGSRRVAETDFVATQNAQTVDVGLSADMNLFAGFQTQNNIKSSRAYYEASLAEINQTENNLSLNVASAYLDIIFNKELLKAAQLQLKNSQEQIERTEKLVSAGALPESNLLEVKAQVASEELNLTNAENALDIAILNLQQLLLLPATTDFDIVVPDLIGVDSIPVGMTPSELYKISLTTQPNIKSAELVIKGAQYSEIAAKGGRYPRIGLSAGLGSNHYRIINDTSKFRFNEFRKDMTGNFGQNIRLQITIPIFNNWQVRSQVQNAIIERKRAELNSIETKNTLRLNVEQAYTNAKAAGKRLNSARNQVAALREAFRVNEHRFNLGAINSLDYTLAKNNLNKAESDFIRAKYDYVFRLKIIDFYQNKPLSFSSNQ